MVAVVAATKRRSPGANPTQHSIAQALTSAALLLPGLVASPAQAAENNPDSVSIQYSRYAEGERDLIDVSSSLDPLAIEVFKATTSLQLGARLGFNLSYTQDTWTGATPVTTAPLASRPNRAILANTANGVIKVGASPFAVNPIALNQQRVPLASDGQSGLVADPREVLVLASASPESRDQIELGMNYDWDNAALELSSGISTEQDYESVYLNAGGRIDLNRQTTSLSFGGGYTKNEIAAVLDPDFVPYLDTRAFDDRIRRIEDSDVLFEDNHEYLLRAGLTQIINQESLVDLGISFNRRSGYLANSYKATTFVFVDPNESADSGQLLNGETRAFMEQRPDSHNQFALNAKYVHYLPQFDAALHLGWEHSNDNWGIDTHALTAEWVQPLGEGWMLTPRLRYYSQDSASFYTSYAISEQAYRKIATDDRGREIWIDSNNPDVQLYQEANGNFVNDNGEFVDTIDLDLLPSLRDYDASLLPTHFSSDHRLSGFGSLSAGLTLRKTWRNSVALEIGAEYYDRSSDLAFGDKGNSAYADFDFWTANAALTIGVGARPGQDRSPRMAAAQAEHADHAAHMSDSGHTAHGMPNLPAGIMFGHMLNAPGEYMFGYHFAFSRRSNELLQGSTPVTDQTIVDAGCPGTEGCRFIATHMNMKMHMLNVMYAPSSSLTLMFMPQFMDMDMNLRDLNGRPPPVFETHEHSGITGHTTGGLSDAVIAGLFRLYDDGVHHVHGTLGASIPLGSVDEELRRTFRNDGGLIHFGMQLGSGTWDLLHSVTYTGTAQRWSWGAQLGGIHRLEKRNDSGYRLGDVVKTSAWGSYSFSPEFSASLRYLYSDIGSIKGDFDSYNARIGPMDFPANMGGRYQDIGIGLSYHLSGRYMGNMLSLEWLQPVRDDVNGFQRARDGSLAAIWHLSF